MQPLQQVSGRLLAKRSNPHTFIYNKSETRHGASLFYVVVDLSLFLEEIEEEEQGSIANGNALGIADGGVVGVPHRSV